MRSLEWLTLLACLTAFLLPLLPRCGGRRWLPDLAALLPLMAAGLHFWLEGWRIQMVPLYLMALLFAALRWRARRQSLPPAPPHLLRLGLTALTLTLAGILPAWLLPVVRLPLPTGPYAVGVMDREIKDPVRARRLMVSVWYPASSAGPRAPLTQNPDEMAAGLAAAYGLPTAAIALQHLRYFTSAASAEAPILPGAPPFPVLVFSHGLVGVRLQSSGTFQELASHGYVVVALDHTDAAAVTVLPNGETRLFDLQRLGIRPEQLERSTRPLLPIWVADQRLVYDMVAEWQATDPLLAGRLDLRRMGSFGHSFGGVTALEVCRTDVRCRAAANLDGGLPRDGLTSAVRPVLLMTSAQSKSLDYAVRLWTAYVRAARGPVDWLELPGSNHYSFTIVPLMSPLMAPWGYDSAAGLKTIDGHLKTFFDLHLRGTPTRGVDPAARNPNREGRGLPDAAVDDAGLRGGGQRDSVQPQSSDGRGR